MNTAQKLRERRSELGLTQSQVAHRANMSTVQYNGYENERHVPGEATLDRLAEALETLAERLRDDNDPAEPTAIELKEALRRRVAQNLGLSPSRVRIFVELE